MCLGPWARSHRTCERGSPLLDRSRRTSERGIPLRRTVFHLVHHLRDVRPTLPRGRRLCEAPPVRFVLPLGAGTAGALAARLQPCHRRGHRCRAQRCRARSRCGGAGHVAADRRARARSHIWKDRRRASEPLRMRAPLGCGHEAKQAAGVIEGQVGPGGHRKTTCRSGNTSWRRIGVSGHCDSGPPRLRDRTGPPPLTPDQKQE